MRIIFSIILSTLITLPAFAKPKAYFDVDDSFWSGPRIVIDGKDHTPGFFGFSNLPEAFQSDPQAQAFAEQYRTYRNWGQGLVWGGLVGAISYLAITVNDDKDRNFDAGTYWTIFLIPFITGAVLQARANTKLIRAINQYNGVYDTATTTQWQFTPADKGLGFAIRF